MNKHISLSILTLAMVGRCVAQQPVVVTNTDAIKVSMDEGTVSALNGTTRKPVIFVVGQYWHRYEQLPSLSGGGTPIRVLVKELRGDWVLFANENKPTELFWMNMNSLGGYWFYVRG